MLDKQAIKKRGVPLLIIKFIDEFLDTCPELKPKGVHQAIVAERKANQILEKENKAKREKNERFIATREAKKEYLFPKELIPDVDKVNNTFYYYFLLFSSPTN